MCDEREIKFPSDSFRDTLQPNGLACCVCIVDDTVEKISQPSKTDDRGKVNKEYGILGDGGFAFNREQVEEKIIGFKPHKKQFVS